MCTKSRDSCKLSFYILHILLISSRHLRNAKKICLYGRLRRQSYSLIPEIFKRTVATSAIVIWSSLIIYHLLQLLTNIYPHVPRGQCVKRPLPRHVIRILSGGLRVFRWDRRRSLASHRSGLNRTSIWAFGHFSSKPLVNVWWFSRNQKCSWCFNVLCTVLYTNYSLKSFLFRVFPQKGHGSDFRNLGSVYGFLDQGFPTSPAEIKVQKEFQKRHGKKSKGKKLKWGTSKIGIFDHF